MSQTAIRINSERLRNTLETFSRLGATDNNGVTRLSLSREDIEARDYFVACCQELGMSVKMDDMANIYATLDGVIEQPPFVVGSHLDSVKKGGRFDGVLGVVAGLEIARTLRDHHIQPRIPFTIVNFTNEEGARFDPAMMCSGVISGKFEKSDMLKSTDTQGVKFGEALADSGYEGQVENRLTDATAFLEMHIEQGPILESESLNIGIVEGVAGMVNYEIKVTGESNHAGSTPMSMRRDALFTATDVIVRLRQELGELDRDLVYTMGRMNVLPNIHTVIPNQVTFTVDARHKDPDVVRQVVEVIEGLPESFGGCSIAKTRQWARDTVFFDAKICDQLEKSAQFLGLTSKRMYSGAGHDAQYIASYLPAAMLFVPSVGGKSHCEEELTSYEDCANGVNVLLEAALAFLK
ncbi:Zn-dependent hydrolase [Alicyclobacillus tolerans]|uniref:Zn-dependent hydrolase n=1 Tax=Alicyclobacillus tolerans TaxID=90970 RepID=UPI001F2E9DF5|nr:Zn-dependent hydrolase [Alicyclobacillus tolerans]MCF8563131.1 Zn-dependent hydrolase [Alicyclobacillus tolerans]